MLSEISVVRTIVYFYVMTDDMPMLYVQYTLYIYIEKTLIKNKQMLCTDKYGDKQQPKRVW